MIEEYTFGRMMISGVEYRADLILFPDSIDPKWWRSDGHALALEDMVPMFAYEPDVIIIGTGQEGLMKVKEEVYDECDKRGILLKVLKTDESVNEYNKEIANKKKRVIGAFHLTC